MTAATARAARGDDRALLLRMIEEAYERPTWNGPNLRRVVRRVTAEEAAWMPQYAGKCIAEIVLHCAYWKYAVARRLTGGKRGGFPYGGSNWFPVERPLTRPAWRRIVQVLDEQHAHLCETVRSTPLRNSASGGGGPVRQVLGVAMHDAYHTGHIRQIRAMYRRMRERSLS